MLLQKPDKPEYDGHYILGCQKCKIEAKGGKTMIKIGDSELELKELFSKDDFAFWKEEVIKLRILCM